MVKWLRFGRGRHLVWDFNHQGDVAANEAGDRPFHYVVKDVERYNFQCARLYFEALVHSLRRKTGTLSDDESWFFANIEDVYGFVGMSAVNASRVDVYYSTIWHRED